MIYYKMKRGEKSVMNTVRIEKKNHITDLRVNGLKIPGVLAYEIRTDSMMRTELVLKLDVSELIVNIRE